MSGMETGLYEYVMARLKAVPKSHLTYEQVAEGSGVSKRTVEKIARGEIQDPGVSHIQKLADWFREQERAAA